MKVATKKGPRKLLGLMSFSSVAFFSSFLIWFGLQQAGQPLLAPLPKEEVKVEATGNIIGADPERSQVNSQMGNNTIYIPKIGASSYIHTTGDFELSEHYSDFYSLKIPDNPMESVWYSGGAPLTADPELGEAGEQGTTFVAAHVASWGSWGAFKDLWTLKGGEVIWTKDGEGRLQKWQVTEIKVTKHTEFPQEYWENTGKRQLVVATCGGNVINNSGIYDSNIFAIAEPIDPKPPTLAEIAEREAKEKAEAEAKLNEEVETND